jgi:hypothetical protein
MDRKSDRIFHSATLIAIGTIAYVVADVSHEALGHGGACLIGGGKITLLTSVYFRSEAHSFVTDAFGPLANLLAGLTFSIFLGKDHCFSVYTFLLLLFCMAFNLFWFSWQCLYAGVTNKGDFAFYMNGNLELLAWRIFLVAFGFLSYGLSLRLLAGAAKSPSSPLKNANSNLRMRRLFLIPYLSAGIAALIAVSFYSPYKLETFKEAFVFPMFLPILFIPRLVRTSKGTAEPVTFGTDELPSTNQQLNFIIWGAIIFLVFCALMGRGMRF